MIFGMPRARFGMVLFGLLAVAVVGLFVWNRVDAAAVDDAENQIVALRQGAPAAAGAPPSDNPVELRRQLADVESSTAMAAVAFPQRVDTLALQDQAVRAATTDGVAMTSVQLQNDDKKSIGTGTGATSFPARGLTIQARAADLGPLLNFVGHMQGTIYGTSVIEGLKVAENDQGGGWIADFNLIVYQRQTGAAQ